MSKDSTLRACELWMASVECFEMFGEDEDSAEQYFWDNLESKFADWC